MNSTLYPMIFKRKSFHIFKGEEHLTPTELEEIKTIYHTFTSLITDIQTAIRIVPRTETTCRRGEYCILLYSEEKPDYLQNIGYLGEQLDLWLALHNIGVCWYGMGKTEEQTYEGLSFVIMLAIEKAENQPFRRDMFKSKRKPLDEIWQGEHIEGISDIVRFAPSACNTQPWIVKHHDNILEVFRHKKPGKRGLMPADRVAHYNRIDIGIFLLFLELCLEQEQIPYERLLYTDRSGDSAEMTLTAAYRLW